MEIRERQRKSKLSWMLGDHYTMSFMLRALFLNYDYSKLHISTCFPIKPFWFLKNSEIKESLWVLTVKLSNTINLI